MSQDKYRVDIDKALIDFVSKEDNHIKNKIKFSKEDEASGKIKKYAFDVYRVDNDPYESLWVLQDFEDGQHLVRASEPQPVKEEVGDWVAVSDNDRTNITLSYKNVPIARFSSKEFGFEPKDIITFKSALLERIRSDEGFVKDVLSTQPSGKREALTQTFPEFKKFI